MIMMWQWFVVCYRTLKGEIEKWQELKEVSLRAVDTIKY